MNTFLNRYFTLPIALVMTLITHAQADWCQDQGIECTADPIITELLGSSATQMFIRNAVIHIASHLDQTCLYGAQRSRQQRRNLCGDRFLQSRLDQIEFVSDLAQRSYQMPQSGLRVMQDCVGLRLQVSSRIFMSANGLRLIKQVLEDNVEKAASLT